MTICADSKYHEYSGYLGRENGSVSFLLERVGHPRVTCQPGDSFHLAVGDTIYFYTDQRSKRFLCAWQVALAPDDPPRPLIG